MTPYPAEASRMLEVLRHNKGFSNHEEWIDYGLRHNFKCVEAQTLDRCPDCASPSCQKLGQYVYYSTLIGLRTCSDCGLVYADTHIDAALIAKHFENAYKDERYFLTLRGRIFDQIARLTLRRAPRHGRVLEIGGAKGHLLGFIKQRRPDLDLVLNDLSRSACEWAEAHYGVKTVCGAVGALDELDGKYDIVIMSDVIYCEPRLKNLWRLIPVLVKAGGTLIIRVPNRLPLIRVGQRLRNGTASASDIAMADHVPFFNPEHLYVFPQRYLLSRLRSLGFSLAVARPSELLSHPRCSYPFVLYYYVAKALWIASLRKFILTPSVLVVAEMARLSDSTLRAGFVGDTDAP